MIGFSGVKNLPGEAKRDFRYFAIAEGCETQGSKRNDFDSCTLNGV